MSKSPTAAVSATYRKAVNAIAEATDQEPNHSPYPSLDFEDAIAGIPDAMKQKALDWYQRGIKRGMAKATDLMAEGTIYIEAGTVYAPKTFGVKVRTKFTGEEWAHHELIVQSKEIGFE